MARKPFSALIGRVFTVVALHAQDRKPPIKRTDLNDGACYRSMTEKR